MTTKNHDMLYLDANVRTDKLQTMIAMSNVCCKTNDIEDVKRILKYTLDTYCPVKNIDKVGDDIVKVTLGSGTYQGVKKQWESKYTLCRDFGVITNSSNGTISISDLAKKIVTQEITGKYYISTVLANYIQIINNKVINPLFSILKKMDEENILEINKNYIENIPEFNLQNGKNDKRNSSGGFFDLLRSSYFFEKVSESGDKIRFNDSLFTIKDVLENINTKILSEDASNIESQYDTKHQKEWCDLLTQENEFLKKVFLPRKESILVNIHPIDKERNRLIYGAPGTGKSYMLEADRINYFEEENYERVTFYPDYSYGQFVGVYKPSTDNGHIKYDFTPGPFLRLLVEALKNKDKNYLVIIEEINRANAAAVFGDMFQLLDRDSTGKSTYAISLSEDVKKYMKKEKINEDKLYLPGNFYIWATMNSADQGVTILDAAFKRRFDEYKLVSINENEDLIKDIEVEINGVGQFKWNDFRKQLNKHLISNFKVREDRLIGPFFIKPSVLQDKDKFNSVFTDKLLMYLAEDVLNHKKKDFFNYISLSEMRDVYLKGENCIFKEEFWTLEEDNIDAN